MIGIQTPQVLYKHRPKEAFGEYDLEISDHLKKSAKIPSLHDSSDSLENHLNELNSHINQMNFHPN